MPRKEYRQISISAFFYKPYQRTVKPYLEQLNNNVLIFSTGLHYEASWT